MSSRIEALSISSMMLLMVFPRRCHRSPGVRVQNMLFPVLRTIPLRQEPDTDNSKIFFHTHSPGTKSTAPQPESIAMPHNTPGLRHLEVPKPRTSTTEVRTQSSLPSCLNNEAMRSRLSWLMDSSGMPLGQTEAHSPMLVQPPNPSASFWATMALARRIRSG